MTGNYEQALNNYDKALNIFNDLRDLDRIACVHARRASAYSALKCYDKAIDDYKAAIDIFHNSDEFRKAITLRELGTTYLILGRWNEAIESYSKALEYFSIKDNSLEDRLVSRKGQTLYSLGLAYLMQTKWQDSISQFEKALAIFREIGDNYNISLSLSSIGIALRMVNLDSGALIYLNDALKIVTEKLHDKNRECLILTQIGEVYLRMHDYEFALNEYDRALKIAEELNENRLKGNILGQIGVVYRRMNNSEMAEPYFKQALKLFAELGDIAKVSWMLEELGQVYIKQGFYDKAIEEYNYALKNISNDNRALIDDNLVNLVEGYVLQAIYRGEIKKYKAALDEIEKLGALGLRGKILRNLGEAYHRTGKNKEALQHLNESLEISRMIHDRSQEGKALSYLGLVHASLAQSSKEADRFVNYSIAILKLEESYKIFKEVGDRFLEGWSLENIGRVYLMQNRWETALENYIKVLELGSNSGFVHLAVALCYNKLGKQEQFKNECLIAQQLLCIEGMNEYNLACLEAICGNREKSISLLKIALNKGQTNMELIMEDPYLRDISLSTDFNELKLSYEYHDGPEMIPFM